MVVDAPPAHFPFSTNGAYRYSECSRRNPLPTNVHARWLKSFRHQPEIVMLWFSWSLLRKPR